jgi:hypothetical protein
VAGLPTVGRNLYGFPSLTFTKVFAATDINYVVEFTTDFVTWNAIPQTSPTIQVALNGMTEIVMVASPYSLAAKPNQFLRLRITRP